VGRFAETCFRKIAGVGARSVKLGNAALYALSEMASQPLAGAELFRLRAAIKYPSARKLLENRLAELAGRSGQGVAELEDRSLPDFELDDAASRTVAFGDARAELTVGANDCTITWFNEARKPAKAPPAAVRNGFKAELAAFKQAAKDIEKARLGQLNRLEQSWIEGRDWRLADWSEHYLRHPLRRPLVETLVWQLGGQDGVAVLPANGTLYDVTGTAVALEGHDRISLWHPLNGTPEQVLAWRERIVELGIVQPIKQAHREVYVLTDAERNTETYSNRFAAHILRQHQFRALCQARGWKYDLQGYWDSHNIPTRTLPEHGLNLEYWVEMVEDEQRTDAYVALHLSSDQVRFVDSTTREPLMLEAIDPLVFSEALRDVDLFVAVTSVANDPGWTDGGPNGRYGNYWRQWAFGDLGQSAETRKQLIAQIAPKLSIADRLEIGEKSLIVTGKRQKYAIHFGSANIQILPANRYLCIVPDRGAPEAEKLRLPFSGDGQLSVILAKAFMLVDESKIKDRTILSQL
jgi:hypothetical protein